MTADLERALADRLGRLSRTEVVVSGLRKLTGGASRDTCEFEVTTPGGQPRRLVLRRDPPAEENPARMALEAAALREAARAGVPVPDVVDSSGEAPRTDIGGSYLIMGHVAGEAVPRRLFRDDRYRDARARMAYQMGRTLARIHTMAPERVPDLPRPEPLEDCFDKYVRQGRPVPTLDLAFRWLFDNRPRFAQRTVVHGDFRTGNLLVTPEGLAAVLDWELVHLGDPMEDLGWLCTPSWRFGSPEPAGGFGSREDLFRGYRDGGGREPDPATVRWWEVFGSLKWAVICRDQAARADSNPENRLELLAIGRRVAECEHDLLEAFDWPGSDVPDVEDDEPPEDLYGRPHLGELLGAVEDFVTEATRDADPVTRYRAKIAANVLSTAQREWRRGTSARTQHARALRDNGFTDEAELALAIRSGSVDVDKPEVAALIARGAAERLAVANPSYRTRLDDSTTKRNHGPQPRARSTT